MVLYDLTVVMPVPPPLISSLFCFFDNFAFSFIYLFLNIRSLVVVSNCIFDWDPILNLTGWLRPSLGGGCAAYAEPLHILARICNLLRVLVLTRLPFTKDVAGSLMSTN